MIEQQPVVDTTVLRLSDANDEFIIVQVEFIAMWGRRKIAHAARMQTCHQVFARR